MKQIFGWSRNALAAQAVCLVAALVGGGVVMADDGAAVSGAIVAPVVAPAAGLIRIDAGAAAPVRDTAGRVWQADQGFLGGDVIERPEVQLTNLPESVIYQSEHYGMDSFTWPLTNGNYEVRLYFAETYDGITGPGDRVFSFTVQGREYPDFDVWKRAGGPRRPVMISTPVVITNGQLQIHFTTKIENPQINGVEIVPLPGGGPSNVAAPPASGSVKSGG